MASKVLVLGGRGVAGRMLCELVLEYSDAEVILAGRDLGAAERAAGELAVRHPGRVTARAADAGDAASLDRAFAGADLVAVAASVLAHTGAVAEAALRAGADYFDLLLSTEGKLAVLEALRPDIEARGRVFITDGGIHPGLSAAVIRALAPAYARLERAAVGGCIRADWNAYDFSQSTIDEFVDEFKDYRVEALRDGVWTKLAWKDATRSFDFGAPFGRAACTIMALEELRRLPESLPALRDCAFYVSGFNPVVDYVVMPLGVAVVKVAPRRLGRPYSRLLTWSLRRFARPPYGTAWQVEAEGVTTGAAMSAASAKTDPASDAAGGPGGSARAGLRLVHPDGYWLTSAAAAACLLQYLDGSLREPGLHLQALAVEPARFLRDLCRMGVRVDAFGVDVAALLGVANRGAAGRCAGGGRHPGQTVNGG